MLSAFAKQKEFWSAEPVPLPSTAASLNHLFAQAKDSSAFFKTEAARYIELAYEVRETESGISHDDAIEDERITRLTRRVGVPGTARLGFESPTTGVEAYFSDSDRRQHRALFRALIRSLRIFRRCAASNQQTAGLLQWLYVRAEIYSMTHALYIGLQCRIVDALNAREIGHAQSTPVSVGADGWFNCAPLSESRWKYGPIKATLKHLDASTEIDRRTLKSHNGKSWWYIRKIHATSYELWCDSEAKRAEIEQRLRSK